MNKRSQPIADPHHQVDLGWALATLLRTYQKEVEVALEGLPGGARAFLVMSLVGRETCNSQVAIADRLGLDKTALTYLLDGLENQSLVRRTPDPNDRRTRHISLTDAGAQTLARSQKAVHEVERKVLARLGAQEADQFQLALVKAAGLADRAGVALGDAPEDGHICRAAMEPPSC
ncbi:MarR family winged helix-turn-helix transcriptional regulator [Pelagibacterium montanilacus]|uniref:MarR family winged helix-turn-helix transcriptional regulator n=1 Tax=Pelagibacterium montanilacus TaxID=2185280 RepID=UPI000F8E4C85|nr:MarR family transcriptional regulator [Pelagibacterium montanilacus]